MVLGFAILGAFLGVWLFESGSGALFALVAGALIGILLARGSRLADRITDLEAALRQRQPAEPVPGSAGEPAVPSIPAPAAAPSAPALAGTGPPASPPAAGPAPAAAPPRPAARRRDPAFDLARLVQRMTGWFSSGNVPVKLGVLLSFIGVSFLVKYAVDRQILVFPLELRLLAVALAGLVLIGIGWRLRQSKRAYALSLQGGGIGILFITIFAALRIWQLLPAGLAFILLVVLSAATAALAVLQNARSLALLGIAGGFLAPVLASTGQGSHVVLFSYYLVLNGAVLAIAWYRAWHGLNLLGFAFTFLIGTAWGYRYYRPELFASTEPFLVLHFLLYQAIAVLYALRQPPARIGLVDGTLVFGTPVIAFALQAALLRGSEYGLAISAVVLAAFYVTLAAWLRRRANAYLRLVVESFAALAIAFATLAIPLALDARWTSAAWALEGAALIWVGLRQQRHLACLAGTALVFAAGVAFAADGWQAEAWPPVLNGNVLGGLLIALGALFGARWLGAFPATKKVALAYRLAAVGLFAWGALWWLGTGWREIEQRVTAADEVSVFMAFTALSFAACAWLGRAHSWQLARRASLALLPLILAVALAELWVNGHLLRGWGWLAWPLAWAVQARVLWLADTAGSRLAALWHWLSLLLLAALLALDAAWWTGRIAAPAWAGAAALSVPAFMALLVWRSREHPPWPVPRHPDAYLGASVILVLAAVVALTSLSVNDPGDPAPLRYLPLLNPFDLAMLFSGTVAWLSLRVIAACAAGDTLPDWLNLYRAVLLTAFFIITTFALVRGVHHFSGVAWHRQTLFDSVVVQTSLSIYWGLLGFAGMLGGARLRHRGLWLAGAGFMALVVVKLFLVDLGNTATLERIISFIGIGALLLVVGYFAPVPPALKQAGRTGTGS